MSCPVSKAIVVEWLRCKGWRHTVEDFGLWAKEDWKKLTTQRAFVIQMEEDIKEYDNA